MNASSTQKINVLKQIPKSANKTDQQYFLKAIVGKRYMKGAMTGSYVEHPVHSLLSAKSQQK